MLATTDPYRALLAAGFRQQGRARFAVVSGLATNVLFGILRTVLFLALYRQRPSVRGLDVADALTYVWVVQALFSVTYVTWQWEFSERVRSGALAVDLVRPVDPWAALLAFDVGRNLAQLLLRSLLPLAGAALLLDLALPHDATGWLAVPVTFVLAAVLGFELRFLQEATAFVTPDYRGIGSLLLFPIYFLAGFVVPVEFFPAGLRAAAVLSPVYGLLAGPVHVVQGIDVGYSLAAQAFWVLVGAAVCRAVMARSVRRVVLAGG